MVDEINWGAGPLRISGLTGGTGAFIAGAGIFLGWVGLGLLLLIVYTISGTLPRGGPAPEHWIGLAVALLVAGGLITLGVSSWRTGRIRTSLSSREGEVKIIDADILSVSPAGRGFSIFRYAFTQDGLRWTAEQTFHGDPLFLDDLASRGAALSLPGGVAELLGPSARQLVLVPEERKRILNEVAALVARRTVVEPDITLLEDMLEGREKKFVRYFREACQAEKPGHRRGRGHDRLYVARRLKGERADTLLQQCRAYFDPPPSSSG